MEKENTERFNSLTKFFGQRIKSILLSVASDVKSNAQEIRLRCGRPLEIVMPDGSVFVLANSKTSYLVQQGLAIVSPNDVEECFRIVCGYSVHTHQSNICNGFVTISGGHRAGIIGTAVVNSGNISAVRDISSINIRISREFKGIAQPLFNIIAQHGFKSVIIAGAPSSGKTTVLRDLARMLSSAEGGFKHTVIIDEREEIAACSAGIPQNDVGVCCDVLSSYPKKHGLMVALRTMSPDIIVMDEVGSVDEVEDIKNGLNSGVNFFLSLHASSKADLLRRPQLVKLIQTGEFCGVALLAGKNQPSVISEFIGVGELLDEINGADNAVRFLGNAG